MSHQNTLEELLRPIVDYWEIDDRRVRWLRNGAEPGVAGFDWWPGDFCVRVRVIATDRNGASGRFKATIQTDFLKDIATDNHRFEDMMASVSGPVTSTYAWIYRPATLSKDSDPSTSRRLWLGSSGYFDRENSVWITHLLATTGILQPINAQMQAAPFAQVFRSGKPDMTRPEALRDAELELILDVVRQRYIPAGKEPSHWIGTGEFEEFTEAYGRSDRCFGYGDATGLILETAFGSDSARIQFFTDVDHLQLGHGLMATLQLPYSGEAASIARAAAELNFLESRSWTEFPLLGGWRAKLSADIGSDPETPSADEANLAFALFLPNLLHRPRLASYVALWFLKRARWARLQCFPDMVDLPIGEILLRRTGEWEEPG